MKVVIIAGGKGTRIASVASEIPKTMIPIDGKPILEYQVELAKRYGYDDFIFIIGHLGDVIRNHFGDGSEFGCNIDYFVESTPLGTAGALAELKEKLTEDFFVFYGDTVMDFDMNAMLRFHNKNHSDATLLLHPNDHPYDSDIVAVDQNYKITHFYNKPHPDNLVVKNLVNAALFIFSPAILSKIKKGVKSHIERDVLPLALSDGLNLYGYVTPEYIKDMGTPDRYSDVCHDVKSGKVARMNRDYKRPAVFLDRDGVINYEVNLLHNPNQLKLIPGAAKAIRKINKSGYLAIVVTNQPVIARNLCSLEELEQIHATLETLLGKEEAYIDAIFYCPHHPDKGYPEERPEYKIECDCRKPKPGLLLQAKDQFNIDMQKSIMIGDRDSDIKAGLAAGCGKNIKIETNSPYSLLFKIAEVL